MAIREARNSRGADDAGNEWDEFIPADCAHADCDTSLPVAPTTTLTNSSNEPSSHASTMKSLLTVTIENAASVELEKALDLQDCDQSCINLSDAEQLEQFFSMMLSGRMLWVRLSSSSLTDPHSLASSCTSASPSTMASGTSRTRTAFEAMTTRQISK